MKKRSIAFAALTVAAVGCVVDSDYADNLEIQTKEQTSTSSGSPERVHLTSKLAAELRKDQSLRVRFHVAEEEFSIAEITGGEIASGTVEDGELIEAKLNGNPASIEDFARASDAFKGPLWVAEQRIVEARREKWRSLGARLGIEEQLVVAIEEGLPSADVVLPSAGVRVLAEDPVAEVQSIALPDPGKPTVTLEQAFSASATGISVTAHPAGWDGTGIGIYYVDGGPLDPTQDCINTHASRLFRYGTSAAPYYSHATQMVCVVQATAPGSRVFYNHNLGSNYGVAFPATIGVSSPPVYVSGLSWGWDEDGKYIGADRDYDNRVMNTRIAHFNSAGNTYGNVSSTGVGYNTITVGASNAGTSPSTLEAYSSRLDPETGANKPEIVAPGSNLDVSPTLSASGTSASTAMATGFAASLMEQWSFLRGRPALLRSYLFANSRRLTGGTAITGPADGYGEINYTLAQAGKWWWWDSVNSGTFLSDSNGDGKNDVVVTHNITSTGIYHAVLSWLVSGTYVMANKKLNMDLDLAVLNPSGAMVGASGSGTRNEEAVRFTARGCPGNFLDHFDHIGPGLASDRVA